MPLPTPERASERLALIEPNAEWDSKMRQSAVAMAIDWDGSCGGDPGGPSVLLMQRAKHPSDPWSGQVSLPGGRAETEDKDLQATAIREAHEELGIELGKSARHLGQLPARRAMAQGGYVDLWITPHVFEITEAVFPQPSREAREAFWLPLASAKRGDLDHKFLYRRKDSESDILLPGWRFEGRVIWGLTYRMLLTLFEQTQDSSP
jgi:8-oxo-dGTP pyrophosphatase MutT (NUDIX family)